MTELGKWPWLLVKGKRSDSGRPSGVAGRTLTADVAAPLD